MTTALDVSAIPPIPKVRLGNYEITRLILGSNPFNGYGHFNNILAQSMVEWFNPENAKKTLRMAQENGINTWQFSQTPRGLADLDRHHAEGGKLQWIILANRTVIQNPDQLPDLARRKPMGILHHGAVTDERWRSGERTKIREFVQRIKDTGVLAGISTHNPLVIETAEEQNWGVDFYMACVYNAGRNREELEKFLDRKPPVGESYFPADPPRMYQTIRQTKKPCLAFKILAAGRMTDTPEQIDRAFKIAFDNIKPSDAVIVGMYPRFSNQIAENADRVRRILGASA